MLTKPVVFPLTHGFLCYLLPENKTFSCLPVAVLHRRDAGLPTTAFFTAEESFSFLEVFSFLNDFLHTGLNNNF